MTTEQKVSRHLIYYLILLGLILIAILITPLVDRAIAKQAKLKEHIDDFPDILKRKKLVAVTGNNSISYFVYRGRPMGFHYDLLKEFAGEYDLELEIMMSSEVDEMISLLEEGACDIIADGLTVTRARSRILDFTMPITTTRQVLVQRKPEGWRKMSKRQLEDSLIRNQLDIGSKTVYVQSNSSFLTRLGSLSDEIGDTIYVKEIDSLEAEGIIELVAEGIVDYTVADAQVAMVLQTYYPQLDVATDVSYPQNLAWAVKPGADSLQIALNDWLASFRTTRKFRYLYKKYFEDQRLINSHGSEMHSRRGGRISPYDRTIKKIAEEYDWDWRLLASLVYQESRFNINARAWTGAFGLMQIMPNTAERFGVTPASPAEAQIRAGMQFLEWLDKQLPLDIVDRQERIKFMMAAYNCGLGHILDARRLAEKYNKDPNTWTGHTEIYMKKKSESKYYRDPVVKHGYARGSETYYFVRDIMERYEHYKNVTE